MGAYEYYPLIEHHVYPGQSIQEAIENNWYRIIVHPGTYYENIDFSGKAITLTGCDQSVISSTIIDGGMNGSVVSFHNGEGPDSILSGFTLRGWNLLLLRIPHYYKLYNQRKLG